MKLTSITDYDKKDVHPLKGFGFPNYSITQDKQIWSHKTNRFIKIDKTHCVHIASAPQQYHRVSCNKLHCFAFNPEDKESGILIGNSNYLIFKDSRVWSYKTYNWMKSTENHKYLYYSINGKYKLVSRLVAMAFVPIPKRHAHLSYDQLEVNHEDLNKFNNHYSNLEWVTRSENMKHAYALGAITIPSQRKIQLTH